MDGLYNIVRQQSHTLQFVHDNECFTLNDHNEICQPLIVISHFRGAKSLRVRHVDRKHDPDNMIYISYVRRLDGSYSDNSEVKYSIE